MEIEKTAVPVVSIKQTVRLTHKCLKAFNWLA